MPLITIDHPDTSQSNRTYLEDNLNAGGTALTVINNAGFAINDFVVVGMLGTEEAELGTVLSLTANDTITLTAGVDFDHENNSPLTQIPWNQIKIYRANSEGGSFTNIDTINVQVDYPRFTRYNDTTGTVSSWYKIAYYNSVNAQEGPQSDPIQAIGFKDRSLGKMRDRVRDFADAKDKDVWPDEVIDAEINEEQRTMQADNWPFTEEVATFGLTADTDSYDIEADLDIADFDRALALRDTDSTDVFVVDYMDPTSFFALKETTNDTDRRPTRWTLWDGKIYFLQVPTATRASSHTLLYYRKLANLDSQNDVTAVTHPDVLVFGAAKRVAMMKGDVNRVNMCANMQKIAYDALNRANKTKQNTGFGQVKRVRAQVFTDEAYYASQRKTLTGA